MKVIFITMVEVEIPDGACTGCAANAFTEEMTQVFESGDLTLSDDDNCQNQGAETEIHPLSCTVAGVGFTMEEQETMH